MKNTKITKIALLVLSVALLVGAAIGFSVSAEETAKEYKILAKNVVYGDKTAVAVAVDATIEEAQTVKVAYYWEEDGYASYENAKLLDTSVAKNLYEDKNPVFVAAGVAAKDLGDVLRLVAYTGEVPAEDDAGWISYSAAEYFYSRLYKDGFINKTEADGIDYNKRLMYEAQLQLSANAQKVLDVDEDGNYIGGTYVDEYNYTYTTDEYVKINGGKTAFDVDTVEPEYIGSASCVGWIVTDLEGNEIEYPKAAFEVNGVISVVPKIEEHTCADNNADHKCDACSAVLSTCADDNADGKCDVCDTYWSFTFECDVTTGVNLYTMSGGHQTALTDSYTSNSSYGVRGFLVADPTGAANKVLKIGVNEGKPSNQTGGSSLGGAPTIVLPKSADSVENGNIHIIEYDFYLESCNKSWRNPFCFEAYDADGNPLPLYTDDKGNNFGIISIPENGSDNDYNVNILVNSACTKGTVTEDALRFGIRPSSSNSETAGGNFRLLDSSTWYRLRVVFNQTTGKLDYSASTDNGETWFKVCSTQTKNAITDEIATMRIRFNQFYGVGGVFYLDDVVYTVTDTMPEMPENNGIIE